MGFSFGQIFGRSKKNTKSVKKSTELKDAEAEKNDVAKKARLLETEGENKGAVLQANQGQSVRKVFGN